MSELTPAPGPHTTRRLEDPPSYYIDAPRRPVTEMAAALAACHNRALHLYGSDSNGSHAWDPEQHTTIGVFEQGGTYPPGSVVTRLAWGRIGEQLAQRILELDGLA